MADITMCQDEACPQRETCYRHAASGTKPDALRQSYFAASPRTPDGCASYHRVRVVAWTATIKPVKR